MATDPRLARSSDPRRLATTAQPPPPPPPSELGRPQLDGLENGDRDLPVEEQEKVKLKFCTVCASNQNR